MRSANREQNDRKHVGDYDFDTLGAPFRVILKDGVQVSIEPNTGREVIHVPDVVGLINAVVRERVLHPRKLNGEELRFVRRSLGLKAAKIADFLDVSAEHWSRCECGTKVLSSTTEKQFRLLGLLGSYIKEPGKLLDQTEIEELSLQQPAEKAEVAEEFLTEFFRMKIDPVHATDDELRFVFRRLPRTAGDSVQEETRCLDGVWSKGRVAA